jgi:hypothetical protein
LYRHVYIIAYFHPKCNRFFGISLPENGESGRIMPRVIVRNRQKRAARPMVSRPIGGSFRGISDQRSAAATAAAEEEQDDEDDPDPVVVVEDVAQTVVHRNLRMV